MILHVVGCNSLGAIYVERENKSGVMRIMYYYILTANSSQKGKEEAELDGVSKPGARSRVLLLIMVVVVVVVVVISIAMGVMGGFDSNLK